MTVMTVSELVDQLTDHPGETRVFYADDSGWLHEIYIGDDSYDEKRYITIEGLSERVDEG